MFQGNRIYYTGRKRWGFCTVVYIVNGIQHHADKRNVRSNALLSEGCREFRVEIRHVLNQLSNVLPSKLGGRTHVDVLCIVITEIIVQLETSLARIDVVLNVKQMPAGLRDIRHTPC